MKKLKFLALLLVPILSYSQSEIQFASENMKQRFISAGADTNNDGIIHTIEAALVTELHFGTAPYTGSEELSIIEDYSFQKSITTAYTSGCPSIAEVTDHGHPPVYIQETNFQGLEAFIT